MQFAAFCFHFCCCNALVVLHVSDFGLGDASGHVLASKISTHAELVSAGVSVLVDLFLNCRLSQHGHHLQGSEGLPAAGMGPQGVTQAVNLPTAALSKSSGLL